MTDKDPETDVADLPEDEQPAEEEADPSASALDYTRDEGTPRADSFSPDPAPAPPAASLPADEAPAE